jgi:hypothetical protein
LRTRSSRGSTVQQQALRRPDLDDAYAIQLEPRFHLRHAWLRKQTRSTLQPAQFLQSKTQGTRSTKSLSILLNQVKELTMEYLILVGVVAMMALYTAIIVGCSKQPEW